MKTFLGLLGPHQTSRSDRLITIIAIITYNGYQYSYLLALEKEVLWNEQKVTEKIKKMSFFHIFLIFKSWLRAVLDPFTGRMRPAGRVFEVPDLNDIVIIMWKPCFEFTILPFLPAIIYRKNGKNNLPVNR